MKEINKINNVHSFLSVYDDCILFYDTNHTLTMINVEEFVVDMQIQLNNDYIFLRKANDICIYIDKEIKKVNQQKAELETEWKSISGKHPFFLLTSFIMESFYDRDTRTLFISLYDKEIKNLLWERSFSNNRGTRTIGNHIFLTDLETTYLKKLDILTGEEVYHLKFQQDIFPDILLYQNIMIIACRKTNCLIGIDVHTGEQLWELENCFNYYNLDESTGLLYGYGGERFEVIDAVKGKKVVLKQFEGSMKQYGIFVSQHMHTLSGDGLYFTSNERQIKFGKINIQNYEIEFVQELIEDKERIGRASAHKPICHNGRLYVLDSVETLHIFEEEK